MRIDPKGTIGGYPALLVRKTLRNLRGHFAWAVPLGDKEADFDKWRAQNAERVEQLTELGRRFRNFLEQEFCWFLETFQFLKGRSRVIALADYNVEKALVLAVPHRLLIGLPEE